MTIAACYVSNEGIIFGADSTASVLVGPEGFHYFDHNQKIFEVGEFQSTIGAITWGLGGLPNASYRTLFALLADQHAKNPANDILEISQRFADTIYPLYSEGFKRDIDRCKFLSKKQPYIVASTDPQTRTEKEEPEFAALKQNLFVGFCIGGYVLPNRTPSAQVVTCDPLLDSATVTRIPHNTAFWGAPNMINRLIFGADGRLRNDILSSKWAGTEQELDQILGKYVLSHPALPIRDAIDFVHACIYSTIKAMKFSSLSQICGGPIELAVITTDRPFRWVRHKEWNAAIAEGGGR